MDVKEEKLKNLLDFHANKFNELYKEDPKSLLNDIDKLYYIIGEEETSFIEKEFWEYFKEKYNLDSLESYFDDFDEMVKVFYYACIMPLDLKSNFLYDPNKGSVEKSRSRINKLFNMLFSFVTKSISSSLLFVSIVISIIISFYFQK